MPVKIFFCYAHEDEVLLNKLKAHLKPLQRQGLIDVWHDRDIGAGAESEQEISEHLNAAQLILLLVSPDFINSDYCYSVEMQRALERHRRKEASAIPIILRPVHWEDVLGSIQALPTDAKPVIDRYWHSQDEAFFDVAKGIRKAVNELLQAEEEKKRLMIRELQSKLLQACSDDDDFAILSAYEMVLRSPYIGSLAFSDREVKRIKRARENIFDLQQADKTEIVKTSRAKADRVINALENPNYEWRTIEGVSEETQLPPEEVQKIISELGEQVIKSTIPDKKGRPLYTTKTHYKRK